MTEEPIGSEEYRARRLAHDFRRNVENQFSAKLYAEFDQDTQSFLRGNTDLASTEIPVFASFLDKNNWLLATSAGIHWRVDGAREQLRYAAIANIGYSAGPELAGKREHLDRMDKWFDTKDGPVLTKHSPWLFVSDCNERRYEILLEAGVPLHAVLNSLMFMLQLEKIHPRK